MRPRCILGADAYNLPVLRSYRLIALVAGLLVSSCSEPVCRSELAEQAGRCIPVQLGTGGEGGTVPKECDPGCSAAAHEVCDGDAESSSCICAPGYQGDPCTWAGVLEDRGFGDEDAWTLGRGATVIESDAGSIDGGIGYFAPRVACRGGVLSQRVDIPDYEVAEPLVAQVTYRAPEVYGLSVGFNRAWTQLPSTSDAEWRTERVCLGEAGYGGSVLVQLGSREQFPTCFSEPAGDIEVDRLSLLPAEPGECPAPGTVLNPTAEPALGGWQFETSPDEPAEVGFAEGAGRGGSSGVRLARDGNERASAWTKLSVPTSDSLPSPALRFWWRGTAGQRFRFQVGRYESIGNDDGYLALDDATGNGSDTTHIYCLPPWTHGNVIDLIFRPLVEGAGDPSELVIDDVEIVSDARCGTSTDILDPGFDAGPTRTVGVTYLTPFQVATLRTDTRLSRTGDGGVLEISYFNEQAVMDFETWVFVPESEGDAGPALFYWSKIPQDNPKPIRSVLGRAATDPRDVFAEDGDWQQQKICLFPEWSGRWFRVKWQLGGFPPIGTAPIDPPVRIYIDDLELTTDTGCRAN